MLLHVAIVNSPVLWYYITLCDYLIIFRFPGDGHWNGAMNIHVCVFLLMCM